MKITFQTEELTHIAELQEDCSAEEIIEKCALLTEASSYSPKLVIKALQKAIDKRL